MVVLGWFRGGGVVVFGGCSHGLLERESSEREWDLFCCFWLVTECLKREFAISDDM